MHDSGYQRLPETLIKQIEADRKRDYLSEFACKDTDVIRRNPNKDVSSVLRPSYVRDIEKIMNNPSYLRYSDKTQVFSLHKNDDISRRAYHVQLVSRIARDIGKALNLNCDLIEAIALGHDLGHTPFGHDGEHALSHIYTEKTGRYFNHNIQSARILDTIYSLNVSLQTLDGIICHNGELAQAEYRPFSTPDFKTFDEKVKLGLSQEDGIKHLCPGTLEGCVVRICDMIAYIGKDRQDAIKLGMIDSEEVFSDSVIGKYNAKIINNLTVDIVKNSYGKPYLSLSPEYYEALRIAKKENFQYIYDVDPLTQVYDSHIVPMFRDLYEKFLDDLNSENRDSLIYTSHINYIKKTTSYFNDSFDYENEDKNDIVCDFISSMTDDFFIDLHAHLFPGSPHSLKYIGYFD